MAASVLGLAALLPSCGFFSFSLSRVEADSPVALDAIPELVVGQARLEKVVEQLGPPDRVTFVWGTTNGRVTRLEYDYGTQRASDLTVHIPRQEVAFYNTGARFFLTYLDALRGKSIVPSEIQNIPITGSPAPTRETTGRRLSDYRAEGDGLSGRALRLSRLRPPAPGGEPQRGPITAVEALVLQGAAEGRDVVRLEFDQNGILLRTEARRGTPRTDVNTQIEESVLQ